MSSVRVPDRLLKRLHEACPRGWSLAAVIEEVLAEAGGPEAVRERLAGRDQQARSRAQVARLRRLGHRSVVLEPDHQVALAEACGRWCRLLEQRGLRHWDPTTGTLRLEGRGSATPSTAGPVFQPREAGP